MTRAGVEDPGGTLHPGGEAEGADRRDAWRRALPFRRYLAGVERNRELWHAVWERARVPEDLLDAVREAGEGCRLLALSEDWCGDAVNVLPVVGRLAEAAPDVELRVLGRDDEPEIMNTHLSGTSRSIPVVILLDQDLVERGWWGPRPSELQAWVMAEGLAMEPKARYREIRRWFARDRGRAVVREIMSLAREACAVR